MSASPITAVNLGAITSGATACDHLAELANTRVKFRDFLAWMLEDDGTLETGFKEALVQQMLFDAAKKGWFVRSSPTTGYLELVQKVPIASLDGTGAVDGDTLEFNGTEWVIATSSEIYLAPTVGGTTLPAANTGGLLSVAHGFASTPKKFKCILECTASDAGYAVGDTADALSLVQRGSGGETRAGCAVLANATLIFAVFTNEGSNPKKYFLPNKSSFQITDGTDSGALDVSKWNVRFWAEL